MAVFVAWGILTGIVASLLTATVAGRLRRTRLGERRKGWQDQTTSQAGALFNVLFLASLVFSVILAWQSYNNAKIHAQDERAALVKLHMTVGALPHGDELRAEVREHTRLLIDNEWPRLETGGTDHDADVRSDHLSQKLLTIQPTDATVQVARTQALKYLDNVLDTRLARLRDAAMGLPWGLVVAVIVAALALISHALLVGLPHAVAPLIPLTAEAALIAMAVFALLLIRQPYHGALDMEPDQLRRALTTFTPVH
ncbi:DUF4239 domain-containing protein [Actinocrispum wychmicini]|uniref:Uncharacterized protein DUF4239 n=1 Tax=Actinocrispum wychmicini TaxID=1213861 RepID=A0A4R2JV87_9PSEU|nr:DUF4239 domain-containing protein [Actinocrispum wychmicini]TCO62962.1 uncharacterized protein DUF4239 [Actinocrispum wychmicini]